MSATAPAGTAAEPVPSLSAVIVNWNSAALLPRCLAALRDHAGLPGPAGEVIVVDNGSTDGSTDLVRERWPEVRLLANDENLGYQRANNQGMRAARGDALLLVNADAFVAPGALDALLLRLEADPRAAVVGPRLVYGDGTWQRWTAGREPTLGSAAAYFWFLERLPGAGRRGVYLGRDVRQACTCDWVSSACMVVRRSALDEIGLMDETYFAYMDDVDLCRRARAAGWRVWYEPSAEVVHLMGRTPARQPGEVSPLALQTFNRYFDRRHGRAAVGALRGIEASGFAARAALYAAAGLAGRRPEHRAAARGHLRNARLSLERAR